MKDYLKMATRFSGSVSINYNGHICDDISFFGSTNIADDYYAPICHAINSHDELVAMNKELLSIINRIIDTSTELEGKAVSLPWSEGYKQCSIDTGKAIIEMLGRIEGGEK